MPHPLAHEVATEVYFAVLPMQSIVIYTQRMQAAGKPAAIEPPMHMQQQSGSAPAAPMADDDSDIEDRCASRLGTCSCGADLCC